MPDSTLWSLGRPLRCQECMSMNGQSVRCSSKQDPKSDGFGDKKRKRMSYPT